MYKTNRFHLTVHVLRQHRESVKTWYSCKIRQCVYSLFLSCFDITRALSTNTLLNRIYRSVLIILWNNILWQIYVNEALWLCKMQMWEQWWSPKLIFDWNIFSSGSCSILDVFYKTCETLFGALSITSTTPGVKKDNIS